MWKSIVSITKPRSQGKCEQCDKPFDLSNLQIHHITYDRVGGNEKQEDLLVVCFLCHQIADRERDRETEEANEEAYSDAARENWLNKWATKKYDEFWGEDHDPEIVEDEFKHYLYKKFYLPIHGRSDNDGYYDFEEDYENGNLFTDPKYRDSRY